LRPALETVLKVLQVKLFGKIDKTISFDFAALSEADKAAEAQTQKTRADIMAVYLDRQVVSPEECRRALANDPDSIFPELDAEDMPELPEEGAEGAAMPEGEQEPANVDDIDKAGAVYDSEEWFTSKGGKHFQLETETGEITKGNVGQKGFSYQSKPLESATPDIAHYETLLKEHGGNAKKAAHEYFKERLQGRHVNAAADKGAIEACFTGGTWQEIKRGMHNDPLKAELVPHMADILVSGQHRKNTLYKKRNDNAVDFYEYKKTVKTSQGPRIAIVDVIEREKSEPKYSVYSMSHDGRYGYESREAASANKASIVPMSSGHSLITRNNTGFVDATIAPFFEVVNLRFAEE